MHDLFSYSKSSVSYPVIRLEVKLVHLLYVPEKLEVKFLNLRETIMIMCPGKSI